MSEMYMPALSLVILGAMVFLVGMLFALRERKQHRGEQGHTT
jgi:hypothetical protein